MNAFTRQEIQAVNRRFAQTGNLWHLRGRHFKGVSKSLIEYHPVVHADTHEVIGYHARPASRAPQDSYALMRLQIGQSPSAQTLFVSLDADDYLRAERSNGNRFLELFRQHAWAESELIVDVSCKTGHISKEQMVRERLQDAGIATVFDFRNTCWDVFSINALIDARVVTFDAGALRHHECAVEAARKMGVQAMLVNVVAPDQILAAKELGIDWLQGRIELRVS